MESPIRVKVCDFSLTYLPKQKWEKPTVALSHINLEVKQNEILSIIGPSRSGKTTLLRIFNRLIEVRDLVQMTGDVTLDDTSIFGKRTNVSELRRRIGMVFARPVVLPKSIMENICYGPRLKGIKDKTELQRIAEESLQAAYLWNEVKDRLNKPALALSGGQQQRLCIARILALQSEIILLDEPTSALDPISTSKIEDTLTELKKRYTIVLVTNNTKQAARIGTKTAFFLMGELIEFGETEAIFTSPQKKKTEDYITGRFG